jgi:hypothetical protein
MFGTAELIHESHGTIEPRFSPRHVSTSPKCFEVFRLGLARKREHIAKLAAYWQIRDCVWVVVALMVRSKFSEVQPGAAIVRAVGFSFLVVSVASPAGELTTCCRNSNTHWPLEFVVQLDCRPPASLVLTVAPVMGFLVAALIIVGV